MPRVTLDRDGTIRVGDVAIVPPKGQEALVFAILRGVEAQIDDKAHRDSRDFRRGCPHCGEPRPAVAVGVCPYEGAPECWLFVCKSCGWTPGTAATKKDAVRLWWKAQRDGANKAEDAEDLRLARASLAEHESLQSHAEQHEIVEKAIEEANFLRHKPEQDMP